MGYAVSGSYSAKNDKSTLTTKTTVLYVKPVCEKRHLKLICFILEVMLFLLENNFN